MTGFGGAAHALSNDCVNGHRDDQIAVTAAEHHAGHLSVEATDSGPLGMVHDDCNPLLCNVLAINSPSSKAVIDQSEAAATWQVGSLAALEDPDNPDRPPNH